MDQNGFAAKSGKLQAQDRILACNGCDFTKNMTNSHVEAIFTEMIQEPLLRMAISRGGFRGNLQTTRGSGTNMGVALEESRVRGDSEGVGGGSVTSWEVSGSSVDRESENLESSTPSRPTIKTVRESHDTSHGHMISHGLLWWIASIEPCFLSGFKCNFYFLAPPAAPSQAPSLSITNTRQIGARHTIQFQRGVKGFGFGLTSRDVKTDEQSQPIYVKAVHHGGPAYHDGRLRIGDRVLEVRQ